MKVRPILYSGPMIRAMLREVDPKSQTRRVVKPPRGFGAIENLHDTDPHFCSGRYDDPGSWGWPYADDGAPMSLLAWKDWLCPYGKPGDLLWVRETCRAHELTDAEVEAMEPPLGKRDRLYGLDGVVFAADNKFAPIQDTPAAADAWGDLYHYRGTRGATVPPIHMPRWASRLTLRITDVRVQRLQEISEEDAKAEGASPSCLHATFGYGAQMPDAHEYARGFRDLWDSINGPGSWDGKPWVWALTFEVIKQNVDAVLASRGAHPLTPAAAKALREGAGE